MKVWIDSASKFESVLVLISALKATRLFLRCSQNLSPAKPPIEMPTLSKLNVMQRSPYTRTMHGTEKISPWVARWSHLVPHQVAAGRVLDVACGAGRHLLHFLRQKRSPNRSVAGIDIAQSAIEKIATQLNDEERARCQLIQADIENGPWPLTNESEAGVELFAGVIVTNYLWRPLLPTLMQSVAVGGVLIYETFCAGNETVGKPSRPDFLLQPGELLRVCSGGGLRVISYEDGFLSEPDRFMQRIACVREKSSSIELPRYPLHAAI